MSLFGQINRIKKIKTNILNAIASKGVSVPEDTKLEDTPTLIEEISGGGSEEWYFENIAYLFYCGYKATGTNNWRNFEIFDYLLKHINQPTSLAYIAYAHSYSNNYAFLTPTMFSKILTIDFSKIYYMNNAFTNNSPADDSGQTYQYKFNLPTCISLQHTFSYWQRDDKCNSYVSLDFQGTTSKVTEFSNTFYCSNPSGYHPIIKEILNFNMDSAKKTSSTFSKQTNLERLTFQGSFGGGSTTSALTLDLSSTSLQKEAIVEMFTSVSENTNGNTRTFKLAQAIYESLSEEELAIATDKGYNVSY